MHTVFNSLSSILELLFPNPQTEFPSRLKIDSSEVIFQAMEEELLANWAKGDIIQLALQSVMSKLKSTQKTQERSRTRESQACISLIF